MDETIRQLVTGLASQQADPFFCLMTLKQKFLLQNKCDKCQTIAADWSIIQNCHDIICDDCLNRHDSLDRDDSLDPEETKESCPNCQTTYIKPKDISSSRELRECYDSTEEFLWLTVALQRELLEEIYQDFEEKPNHKTLKPEVVHSYSATSSLEKHNIELQNEPTQSVSQSSTDLFDGSQNIQENDKEQSSKIDFWSSLLSSDKIKKPTNTIVDNTEQCNNILKAAPLNNLQLNTNNSSIIDSYKGNDNPIHKMSDNLSSTSSRQSEDYIVEGTSESYSGYCDSESSDSVDKECKNKIVITYTNLETIDELDILKEFLNCFGVHASTPWCDNITHLIVKPDKDGKCLRTSKYLNALLSNCTIVCFQWLIDCLASKSLLPEGDYMPLDVSGEHSPLTSWRVAKGMIYSPMLWTKDCILYFHKSIKYSDIHPDVINSWAKKIGFTIANELDDFKDEKFKMRFILIEIPNKNIKSRSKVPEEKEISSWIFKYEAVTLFLDWFLECLFRYRFVRISSEFLPGINEDILEFIKMNESLFDIKC